MVMNFDISEVDSIEFVKLLLKLNFKIVCFYLLFIKAFHVVQALLIVKSILFIFIRVTLHNIFKISINLYSTFLLYESRFY